MSTGWIPSTFNARDLRLDLDAHGGALPAAMQLRCSLPVLDQMDLPCCVSATIIACMEILDERTPPVTPLSPMFHYYYCRPVPKRIGPVELREGLRVASRTGACRYDLHPEPLTAEGARKRPSPAAKADAKSRTIIPYDPATRTARYWRVDATDLMPWKRALVSGMPLAIGFWATPAYHRLAEWTSAEPARHGPIDGLTTKEGHAVVVLGYDDELAAFFVRDSRGAQFGSGGYWYLPYEMLRRGVVQETWAVERISYI